MIAEMRRPVRFIKIDVAGVEPLVFRGTRSFKDDEGDGSVRSAVLAPVETPLPLA